MATDFKVVDHSLVPARTGGVGRAPTELSLAIEDGKTVFIPNKTHKQLAGLRSKAGYLAKRGFQVHMRTGELAGAKGVFAWAEKNGK